MKGEVSDIQEAFADFRLLYQEFKAQPTKPFLEFRQKLEYFVVNGNKVVMCLAQQEMPNRMEAINHNLKFSRRYLTQIRNIPPDCWGQKELETLKYKCVKCFEKTISNLVPTSS